MSADTTTADSATLDAVSPPTRTSAWRRYGRLWRGVPRELGFLLLSLPIVVAGLGVLNGLFWPGIGTLLVYVGFFLVLVALYVARGFGTLELVRLRWAGRRPVTRPRWTRQDKPTGFLRTTFGPFANGHYWLYLLHGLLVGPIVGITTWVLTLGWVATGLGGVTYWFWHIFLPDDGRTVFLSRVIFTGVFPGARFPVTPWAGEILLYLLIGVLFLASLPFVTRGLTLMHRGVALALLGTWRSEELRREVADLNAQRGAAVAAEDVSLRRLERDIHDGPQQRLLRLQMDLAAAERRLEAGETGAAGHLLAQARGQAGDTLDELRALSRGVAPPILQDRGLAVALESLAVRSTVPTRFDNGLAGAPALPGEVERSAYFVAAELLTNVAKHSGATEARLTASWRDPVDDAPTGTLSIWVADNGTGGAAATPGHGLSGLQERLRGLRGSITIDSPAGGPTVVGAHIPVETAAE